MTKIFELKRTHSYFLVTELYVPRNMNVCVFQNTYIHAPWRNLKQLVNVIAIIFTSPELLLLHRFILEFFNTSSARVNIETTSNARSSTDKYLELHTLGASTIRFTSATPKVVFKLK